jgi:putative flavoprotein involved in K+ transport
MASSCRKNGDEKLTGCSRPRFSGKRALVVGGGPAGLAAAAELARRGIEVTVLERSSVVAPSWRTHQDHLRLRTIRSLSGLPGLPIPRSYGRWVARDDFVRYLEHYVERHKLDVRTGVEVERIDRGSGHAERRWIVRTTEGEILPASIVVVATGYNHTPSIPAWQGTDEYAGQILHASSYGNALAFQGKDVLVVGSGNSGTEIAVDLAQNGAGRIRLAVRTPPHLVPRDVAGWPTQLIAIMARPLPRVIVDRVARWYARLRLPDLSEQGLGRPPSGLYTRVLRDRRVPVQDVGLSKAVRSGRIEPTTTVDHFERDRVVLADRSTITPDAVIAATGYRHSLEAIVGHLDVLDAGGLPRTAGGGAAQPGLHFIGYTISISGALHEIAMEARRIGAAGSRELATSAV